MIFLMIALVSHVRGSSLTGVAFSLKNSQTIKRIVWNYLRWFDRLCWIHNINLFF